MSLLVAVMAMTAVFFIVVTFVVMTAVTMTRSIARTAAIVTMALLLVTIIVMRTVAVIQQRTEREAGNQRGDDIVIMVGTYRFTRQHQSHQPGRSYQCQFISSRWISIQFVS